MKRIGIALLTTAVLAGCLSALLPATAQDLDALGSVATAGKQRMLSQRVVKAHAQLVLGVAPDKASKIQAASLEELKSNNTALRRVASEADQPGLQAQGALIDRLAQAAAAAPNPASLKQVVQLGEELLDNAEGVTQALVKSGGKAPAAMVNLAARQRMLSQRAAASYLVYQSLKSPEVKARALKATSEFKAAISAFDDVKTEFPQVADRIEMARMQMVFFDNALSGIDDPLKEQFTTVATTSERILSEMDGMTADLIKQLAARNAAAVAQAKKK